MNQLIENNIENLIYEIRGKQVMLDSDLAKLYGCKNGTKNINLAVKRHINRFQKRFCFQITNDEYKKILRFQTETLEQGKYSKYLPYAFTEERVAMLSTILRTPIAEEVSIKIMDAFVSLRRYVNNYELRISNIETKIIDYDNKFDRLFEALDKKITIITNKYNNIDISKYKEQYSNLNIKINNKFHDRFIIIDKKILYHSGASFKDLENKCFSINKIEDKEYLDKLLEKIN